MRTPAAMRMADSTSRGAATATVSRRNTAPRSLRLASPRSALEGHADRAAMRAATLRSGARPGVGSAAAESAARIAAPESVERTLASPGSALDTTTRSAMERTFATDFSSVRVHHDATAAAGARELGARAYALGRDVVFGAGAYAPHTLDGRRLIAHELAHVVQQRGGEPVIQREMYYSSGYKQVAYGSAAAELEAAKAGKWHPGNADMAATASGSGGGEPIATVDALLTALESKGKGAITRLNLIGHSSSSAFAFGGTIKPDDVLFDANATIDADMLSKNAARITNIKDRFAEGAKIVLYGCNAGSALPLLEALSNAFGVCVQGFTTEVWWCIMPGKEKNTLVRGRTWAENPHDPLPAPRPDCAQFASDVTTLKPGRESCAGAPKPKEAP